MCGHKKPSSHVNQIWKINLTVLVNSIINCAILWLLQEEYKKILGFFKLFLYLVIYGYSVYLITKNLVAVVFIQIYVASDMEIQFLKGSFNGYWAFRLLSVVCVALNYYLKKKKDDSKKIWISMLAVPTLYLLCSYFSDYLYKDYYAFIMPISSGFYFFGKKLFKWFQNRNSHWHNSIKNDIITAVKPIYGMAFAYSMTSIFFILFRKSEYEAFSGLILEVFGKYKTYNIPLYATIIFIKIVYKMKNRSFIIIGFLSIILIRAFYPSQLTASMLFEFKTCLLFSFAISLKEISNYVQLIMLSLMPLLTQIISNAE